MLRALRQLPALALAAVLSCAPLEPVPDAGPGVASVVLLAEAHLGVHEILERALAPGGEVLVDDAEPEEPEGVERRPILPDMERPSVKA